MNGAEFALVTIGAIFGYLVCAGVAYGAAGKSTVFRYREAWVSTFWPLFLMGVMLAAVVRCVGRRGVGRAIPRAEILRRRRQ